MREGERESEREGGRFDRWSKKGERFAGMDGSLAGHGQIIVSWIVDRDTCTWSIGEGSHKVNKRF